MYEDWNEYLKLLSTQHKLVAHLGTGANQKKYFEASMEEVITGITKKLPGKSEGPFVVFAGYLDRVQFTNDVDSTREIMFFVMHSCGTDNFSFHPEAKTVCEQVVHDFISRFNEDSENEVAIWEQSFNAPQNISIIPNEFKAAGTTYIGWQVVVSFITYPDLKFYPDKWNL
jgi:hypothetical protein